MISIDLENLLLNIHIGEINIKVHKCVCARKSTTFIYNIMILKTVSRPKIRGMAKQMVPLS